MSDLISKNEAVKIAKGFTFTFTEERQRYMDFLEYCLNNAPTVDAKSVVYGKWIHDINNVYGCSVCMNRETMSPKKMKNFCPNCGAYMKKGE